MLKNVSKSIDFISKIRLYPEFLHRLYDITKVIAEDFTMALGG